MVETVICRPVPGYGFCKWTEGPTVWVKGWWSDRQEKVGGVDRGWGDRRFVVIIPSNPKVRGGREETPTSDGPSRRGKETVIYRFVTTKSSKIQVKCRGSTSNNMGWGVNCRTETIDTPKCLNSTMLLRYTRGLHEKEVWGVKLFYTMIS